MTSAEYRLVDTPTLRWIGLILLSGITLLGILPLGMIDTLHPLIPFFSVTHLGLLFLATAGGVVYLYRLASACRWPRILTWCALAVPLSALVLLGRLPTIDPAALERYLALPKWWLDSTAIVPFLWYPPSLEPNLVGLAFMELLNNDGVRFIPVYLFLSLVCLATLTARFIEHRTHRKESACLAFLLILTVPIALRSATVPWPNLPAALFFGLALMLIIGWLEEERRRSTALLAGISMGLGAGCSADSIVALLAVFPAFLCAAFAKKIGWWRAIAAGILILCSALVFFSPWLIKNGLWLANPFYPLGGDLLGTNALVAGDTATPDLTTTLITLGQQWREVVLAPFTISLLGQDGGATRFDGVASPLFVLAIIPLWIYRKHPSIIFLGLFIELFLIGAAIGGLRELRDLLPVLFPVTALTILGIGSIGRLFKRRFERSVVGFLVAAQIVSCSVYVAERAHQLGALSLRIDVVTYLRNYLSDYQMVERINEAVPPTNYIYDLRAVSSFFYLTPRIMTGGVDRVVQIEQWLRSSISTHALAQEFINRGIHFLAFDEGVVSRALTQRNSPRETSLWNDFIKTHLEPVAQIGPKRLGRIEPKRGSSQQPSPIIR